MEWIRGLSRGWRWELKGWIQAMSLKLSCVETLYYQFSALDFPISIFSITFLGRWKWFSTRVVAKGENEFILFFFFSYHWFFLSSSFAFSLSVVPTQPSWPLVISSISLAESLAVYLASLLFCPCAFVCIFQRF